MIILKLEQWKEILGAVNSNEGDILKQIKDELENKDSSTYEDWKRNGFCINHKFDVEYDKFSLLYIAVVYGYLKVVKYLIDEKNSGEKLEEKK